MSNIILHEYRIPVPGMRRRIIYQFSDVHLSFADQLSTPAERAAAAERTQFWVGGRVSFAKQHQEPHDESAPIAVTAYFEDMMQAAAKDGDALVITGDLFDQISPADIRWYENRFASLPLPHVYVGGNHEPLTSVPDQGAIARIKSPLQLLDLGDMLIAGFHNADRTITQEHLDALLALIAQPKPVVIAMHIPIQVAGNVPHANCDDYFRLNHAQAPQENEEFIDLISQNAGKIVAVLAGHLHFLNTCELTPGLTQYVSSQGLLGNLNRYVIGDSPKRLRKDYP